MVKYVDIVVLIIISFECDDFVVSKINFILIVMFVMVLLYVNVCDDYYMFFVLVYWLGFGK